MEVEKIWEYCRERKAMTTCEVCAQCKLPYGCKVYEGGERKFEGEEDE